MLQISTSFVDLFELFNSLNIEFKVLIAIIAIPLCMVFIYVAFKLIEIFFLFLKVILDGFLKIFRKSSEIKGKIRINNNKSETTDETDPLKQEKNEEIEVNNLFDSDGEEEEEEEELSISEEKKNIIKNMGSINASNHQEFTSENSITMVNCPNCGNIFSQNSYSKIGDTVFVSCEECGKRYITNGEIITEN